MRRACRLPVSLAVILGVSALVGPLAGAAWAPKGPNWKSQSVFSEQFFNAPTNETVNLAGTMSVTIKISGDQFRGFVYSLHAVVHHVIGTGTTSGGAYSLKGHDDVVVHFNQGAPVSPVDFAPSFTLHPPGPCRAHHPPNPCFNPTRSSVPVAAFLDANGSVTGVQAGSSTT